MKSRLGQSSLCQSLSLDKASEIMLVDLSNKKFLKSI